MRSRTIISIITAAILITACNSPENSPSVDVGNHNAVSETSVSENIVINDKRIVGFTTPESSDGSYSLDLYKSNGKLIEKIFLWEVF